LLSGLFVMEVTSMVVMTATCSTTSNKALLRSLIHALHENIVQLLCHRDLCMLKLGKGVDHHGVVEVLLDHALKNLEVISRKLTDALVQCVSNALVGLLLSIEHLLYIVLTFGHVYAKLRQVPQHQFFIGKELLVLH